MSQTTGTDLQEAIKTIRKRFDAMSTDERLDVVRKIMDGYCSYSRIRPRTCYCWNDD